jgi:hypothetical protein
MQEDASNEGEFKDSRLRDDNEIEEDTLVRKHRKKKRATGKYKPSRHSR